VNERQHLYRQRAKQTENGQDNGCAAAVVVGLLTREGEAWVVEDDLCTTTDERECQGCSTHECHMHAHATQTPVPTPALHAYTPPLRVLPKGGSVRIVRNAFSPNKYSHTCTPTHSQTHLRTHKHDSKRPYPCPPWCTPTGQRSQSHRSMFATAPPRCRSSVCPSAASPPDRAVIIGESCTKRTSQCHGPQWQSATGCNLPRR
jgi:hypothetical protein